MRLPKFRLTIRTLMITIAVLGTILGAGIGAVRLKRRSVHFQQRANEFANQEITYTKIAGLRARNAADCESAAKDYAEEFDRWRPGVMRAQSSQAG